MTNENITWLIILALLGFVVIVFLLWRKKAKKKWVNDILQIIRNDENKTLKGDGDFRRGAWCLTPVAERECFEREEQQRIKKDAKCKKCGSEKILLRIRGMPNQGAILAFEEIFYDVELMGCVIDASEEFFQFHCLECDFEWN